MRSLCRIAVLFAAVALAGCDRDSSSITAPSNTRPFQPSHDVAAAAVATPQVTAGAIASCGLRVNGAIVCWGDDLFGMVSAAPNGSFTQVDITHFSGCAVSTAGGIACWGFDAQGQTSPPGLPEGLTYTRVSMGYTIACALRSDASIGCWGFTLTPGLLTSVPAGQFVDVGVGENHACAVSAAGAIVCWGADYFGQLSQVPVAPTGQKFTKVSVGRLHSCALLDDGSARCWGANQQGQTNVPTLPSGVVYTDISASNDRTDPIQGRYHTCAVRSDGAVVCWGESTFGQLNVPALPAGMTYLSVDAGAVHTCAVRSDGAPVCWGFFGDGRSSPPSTLNLTRDPQTIVFTPSVPADAAVAATLTLVPNVGSGEPLVLVSSTPLVCTIADLTLSFVGAGTCTFTANRAGNSLFLAAPQVVTNINVIEGRAAQEIAFTSQVPSPAYVNATYDVAATGGKSGNVVTFASLTIGTCTVVGSTVTFKAAGDCTIAADQTGNASYLPAPQITQTIHITRRPQAIAFTPAVPPEGILGSQLAVGATGGASGQPVLLSVLTPATCSLTAGQLRLTGVGDCTVQASQAGDVAYDAAPTVTKTVGVRWPFSGFTGLGRTADDNRPKAGSTVELTFALGGNRGLGIIAPNSPTAAVYACSATPPAAGSGSSVRSSAALDYTGSAYVLAWKTEKAWSNKCVQLSVTLTDGSVRTALFRFR